jgi:hypothetical protein
MHTVRRTLSFVFGGALLTLAACEQAPTPLEPSTSNTPPATGLGSYVTKASYCDGLTGTCSAWEPTTVPSFPPHIAIHMHLLPTGEILFWPGEEGPTHGSKGFQYAYIWNPVTGTSREIDNTRTDVFCSGHSFLPDGRLLVTGGHIADGKGRRDVNIFDPFRNTWSRAKDMNAGRWYPTNTTLANGDVLVVAGTDENGNNNTLPQVWSAAKGGAWRSLTSATRGQPYYPFMFLAPDGRVFYAGPGARSAFLNTAGSGAWADGPWTVNQIYRDYGSAVMYAPGKILMVGGGGADGSSSSGPTNTAEIIDLSGSATWQATGSMSIGRRQHNATVLADGKVLVTGGTSGPGFNNESAPVTLAELWDPATNQFTKLTNEIRSRMYHSSALLLPDGRVLSAGGGRCGGCLVQNADAQVFSPPYLFNGDGTLAARPVINSAPTRIGYGTNFTLGVANPFGIARISLVRIASVTHAFNQNQRFVPITAFQVQGSGLSVTAPSDRNIAPPGHYMLFVLNVQGVPSEAKIVQLL